MTRRMLPCATGVVVAAMLVAAGLNGAAAPAARTKDVPETVMLTLHAKPGSEAEAARVLADHWDMARRLKLVLDAPHLTLRSVDSSNKTSFVEIFTWRDAAIPDAAPEAIRKIWDAMHKVAEARQGRPALEVAIVDIVATK